MAAQAQALQVTRTEHKSFITNFIAGDSGVFTLGNGARVNDDNTSPTDSSQLSQVRDQRHSYDATDGYAPFDGQLVS